MWQHRAFLATDQADGRTKLEGRPTDRPRPASHPRGKRLCGIIFYASLTAEPMPKVRGGDETRREEKEEEEMRKAQKERS